MALPDDFAQYYPLYSLQQSFVDKTTGLPLSNGKVYFYHQNNQTVLKPIYQLIDTGGNFTFEQLPNPIILSGVGTPVDASGNDVVIYALPYDSEDEIDYYFVRVFDENNVVQFTRELVPSGAAAPGAGPSDNFQNLLTNGSFLFNVGSINTTDNLVTTIAAGAATNMVQPDIILRKNVTAATDAISFIQFQDDPTGAEALSSLSTVTPQYFLEYKCTNVPVGETIKQIEIPVTAGVQALSGQFVTISFIARSAQLGTATIYINQYFGTGGTTSGTIRTATTPFTLTADWALYSLQTTIPSVIGHSFGSNNDNYLTIGIQPNLGTINTTDLTCVQMVLGENDMAFLYEPPPFVAAKVFAPRTGEVKFSYSPQPPGWLLMNDGTIGNLSSGATSRAAKDTFPLFSFIWAHVSQLWAPMYASGGTGAPLQARGASASADYAANYALSLPRAVGRVMAGVNVPNADFQYTQNFTVNVGASLLLVAATENYYIGQLVRVSSSNGPTGVPGGLGVGEIYYVTNIVSDTSIQLAASMSDAQTDAFITLTSGGTGVLSVTTWIGTPIFNRSFIATNSGGDLLLSFSEISELYDATVVTVYPGTGGTLPTGLTAGVPYYCILSDPSTVFLTTQYSSSPTLISYTDSGTAPYFLTVISNATVNGQAAGEEQHTQVIAELARHSHTYTRAAINSGSQLASGANLVVSPTTSSASSTGNNSPFNIIQPTTYVPIYIKL